MVTGKAHHHILGPVVDGDVALLNASAECFSNVSVTVDENCRVAAVGENLVRAPIAERLPDSDERPRTAIA